MRMLKWVVSSEATSCWSYSIYWWNMGPLPQKVSLQLWGACFDLKLRSGHLCPDEVCSRRKNQSFLCKIKGQCGIKLNFTSFLSSKSEHSAYLVCVCYICLCLMSLFSMGGCVQCMHACPHPAWHVLTAVCHKNGNLQLRRRKREIRGRPGRQQQRTGVDLKCVRSCQWDTEG